ncbi:MAG: META domain-containing protein [Candidatus Limnocylindrales bacterium]
MNQFSGPARGDDARLTLGPLTLTRKGGAPDATDAETAFVSALESTASYRVEVDRLELLDADGQTLVRLARPGST